MSYGEGGTKLAILVEKIQKMKKEKKVQINVAHWQKEKPINLELRKKKKKKKEKNLGLPLLETCGWLHGNYNGLVIK